MHNHLITLIISKEVYQSNLIIVVVRKILKILLLKTKRLFNRLLNILLKNKLFSSRSIVGRYHLKPMPVFAPHIQLLLLLINYRNPHIQLTMNDTMFYWKGRGMFKKEQIQIMTIMGLSLQSYIPKSILFDPKILLWHCTTSAFVDKPKAWNMHQLVK